jgi:hypothetical protein
MSKMHLSHSECSKRTGICTSPLAACRIRRYVSLDVFLFKIFLDRALADIGSFDFSCITFDSCMPYVPEYEQYQKNGNNDDLCNE